jgi:anti-anti-sigma regulatory factor
MTGDGEAEFHFAVRPGYPSGEPAKIDSWNVLIRGKLDAVTTRHLIEAIDRLHGRLTLDINDVTTIDPDAFELVLELQDRLESTGSALWLRGVRGRFSDVFRIVGGEHRFHIEDERLQS